MQKPIWTGILLAGLLLATSAFSQDLSRDEAQASVDTRRSAFKLLAYSTGQLRPMARGGEFNEESVQGLNTRATDTLWRNKDDFEALANSLQEAATSAVSIFRDQGQSGASAALQAIGDACGTCHQRYRLQE